MGSRGEGGVLETWTVGKTDPTNGEQSRIRDGGTFRKGAGSVQREETKRPRIRKGVVLYPRTQLYQKNEDRNLLNGSNV